MTGLVPSYINEAIKFGLKDGPFTPGGCKIQYRKIIL
jgi:hypothetical protein